MTEAGFVHADGPVQHLCEYFSSSPVFRFFVQEITNLAASFGPPTGEAFRLLQRFAAAMSHLPIVADRRSSSRRI